MATCGSCKGNGECSHCDGKGKKYASALSSITYTCGNCGGSGKCKICKGTGKV